MAVKSENVALTPSVLRAYMARHRVSRTDLARRRSVTHQAISAALYADVHKRPVSQSLLRALLDLTNAVLIEREQEAPCL